MSKNQADDQKANGEDVRDSAMSPQEPEEGEFGLEEDPVCAICGHEIAQDDLVCPNCGTSLVAG